MVCIKKKKKMLIWPTCVNVVFMHPLGCICQTHCGDLSSSLVLFLRHKFNIIYSTSTKVYHFRDYTYTCVVPYLQVQPLRSRSSSFTIATIVTGIPQPSHIVSCFCKYNQNLTPLLRCVLLSSLVVVSASHSLALIWIPLGAKKFFFKLSSLKQMSVIGSLRSRSLHLHEMSIAVTFLVSKQFLFIPVFFDHSIVLHLC